MIRPADPLPAPEATSEPSISHSSSNHQDIPVYQDKTFQSLFTATARSGMLNQFGAVQGVTLEGALSDLDALLELADGLPEFNPAGLEFSIGQAQQQQEPSPLSLEDSKREKTRERERRKYRRKKEKLGDLQRQVSTLEHELKKLSSHPSAYSTEADASLNRPSGPGELKPQLVELKYTKARLRSENTQLRRQFREAAQRAVLLSDLLKTELKLYSAHASYFRLLVPLSPQTCFEISNSAVQRTNAFEASLGRASTVGTVAGWRGRRFADRGVFKFALDKVFRWMSYQAVLERVWSSLVDPMKLERCYSPELNMRARLIQKVDDDNIIFLEEMRSTDSGDNEALVQTAVLFSRVKTDTGCRIYLHHLNRQQIEMEERSTGEPVKLHKELWITNQQLVWVELGEVETDGVSVRFRGVVETIGATAYFWMSEVIMLSLRVEFQVFGPRFTLPVS